jgi:glycosyltransferase involved in cell wall biosynthesis
MKRSKLVYVVSDINKALSFEWLTEALKSTYDLRFILIGEEGTKLEKYLREHEVDVYVIADTRYTSNFKIWFRLIWILWVEKPVIVHAHLWRATLMGITASWILRVRKRVFTRHHATIHYDQYPSGRKWDRLCNLLATDVIAISKSVHSILENRDNAESEKVSIVHHGFKWNAFVMIDHERVAVLRSKYNINEHQIVIGVVSRYLSLKGIQYVIPAFYELQKRYPNSLLLLANAHGIYKEEITNLLQQLPSTQYREVEFEDDLGALYQLMNVFVHVPIEPTVEAFGQTYVEALASGIPSVFTLSGVAPEFIVHEQNALVVPFKDSTSIENAIVRLLEDKNLRERLMENGRKSIDSFSLERMVDKLKRIYDS